MNPDDPQRERRGVPPEPEPSEPRRAAQERSTRPTSPENGRRPAPRLNLGAQLRAFPITFGTIGITALVFLGQMFTRALLGTDLVLTLGAKVNELILAGELWRLVTPVLIHAGFGHFFVNMYSLYAIGPAVERTFGPVRMLAVYWLSGICGVLFSLAFSPHPSVGASGAIFGLLGSLGTFLYANRATFGALGRSQLRQIVFVAVLNLALGLSPGIDNWGHLGGLVYGAGLSWFVGPLYTLDRTQPEYRRLVDQRPWERVWPMVLAGAALLGVLIWAAVS